MRRKLSPIMGDSFRCAAAVLLAAAVLQSCSDDNMPNENVPDLITDGITIGNNPAEQKHRVTFYGKPIGRATRAGEDFPTVGEVPSIPAGIPSYSDGEAANQDWQNEAKKTAYILTAGRGQIYLYGETNLYITGEVSTHNINGSGTIYVMPGAKLTLSDGFNNQDARIVVFGTLETMGNVTVGNNGSILGNESLTFNGDLNVQGAVVANKELTVTGKIQYNSKTAVVKAQCINVEREGDRSVDMSGGGRLVVGNHLFCEGLYLGSEATVYMCQNAMAEVTVKTAMTSNNGQFVYYGEETDGRALLLTDELHVEGGADSPAYINGMFAHEVKVDYTTLTNAQPAHINDFMAPATDYRIPAGDCAPGHALGEPEKPSFDPIAVIESPTHNHEYLSATCVQAANGKAYVSYHLNEAYSDNADYVSVNKHQGCVEVYDVTEADAQITSWLLNEDHDFNHLIVDGDKMFTTGDMKAGGRMGIINLENGQFGQQSATMSIVKLNGTSGNCIIRDGSSFRIATNLGFQSLDALTYEDNGNFIETSGSAKHLALGNGVIATLNLNERGVTSSPATVSIYRNGWGTPSSTFATESNITPINGKNTIAVDGENVYVCLGENGVEKYSLSGEKLGYYNWKEKHPNSKGRPCANGLAVDDKYLYVAYGGAGMYVFDKQTMTQVARYYHRGGEAGDTEYSANYVALVNGYIYISYGRNGLEVVKMNVPNN